MSTIHPKKLPRDPAQLAKRIVELATGETDTKHGTPEDAPGEPPDPKHAAAVALGRLGGQKGGKARAAKLTPEERQAIARKAARARWGGEK